MYMCRDTNVKHYKANYGCQERKISSVVSRCVKGIAFGSTKENGKVSANSKVT